MRRILLFFVLAQLSVIHNGQIIADHSIVGHYKYIPQNWIDSVKTMLVVNAGESHSAAVRIGMEMLEEQNSRFKVYVSHHEPLATNTETNVIITSTVWGDYNNASGWIHDYGENDFYTNATALTRTKAGITYCNDNSREIAAYGFGWCWDDTRDNVSVEADPVYGCRWYGKSANGPQGDLEWGLDSDDSLITGNSVCMDTYLNAVDEYIQYCSDNGYTTKMYFTTGPVDTYYAGEAGYQGYVKHEYIRDYVATDENYFLFDYADILCYDDGNETANTSTWNGNTFPIITTNNLGDGDVAHIDSTGALRLGKAMWWMLARIAGWDGSTGGEDTTPPSVPSGLTLNTASETSVSFSWNASTDNVGVSGYRIFRDGTALGTTSGLTYTDNTVNACSDYNYTVSAYDASGNESLQSSGLAANTDIAEPEGTITQPTCTTRTGTIEITYPTGPSIEYSIDGGSSWSSGTSFLGLAAGATYNISVRNTTADPNCISSSDFTINEAPPVPSPPVVSNSQPENICPSETVDLSGLVTSTTPTGGLIFYKTTNNSEGTEVSDPTAVGAGSYYLFYQNQEGCYSTGTEVVVTINSCSTEAPDITPTLIVTPNIMHGITNFDLIVRVTELKMTNTSGIITVNIPKESRWSLPDGFVSSLTVLGTTELNNSEWVYGSDATNHIFTSSTAIPAGGSSTFGFRVTFDPGGATGVYTITSQIESGGGGELKVSNNADSEKIDYFQE